jgi:hypothetical protein
MIKVIYLRRIGKRGICRHGACGKFYMTLVGKPEGK